MVITRPNSGPAGRGRRTLPISAVLPWRQASLPDVKPGFPARRPSLGGRDATRYVRQGCLTLRGQCSDAPRRTLRQRGSLMVELMVAVALLLGVFLPLAYSFISERRLARAYYNRAVAMEIVDGEMEALVAGEWRAFQPGTHDYKVHSAAATNLPPGRFSLTVQPNKLRLRWQPAIKDAGGSVTREARIQ